MIILNMSKKELNFNDIEDNLNKIRKKLYLESPDLWIDFCGKVDENILDEMVLFYAAKYNYANIIKFATDNKMINLNNPSKNKTYKSINEHLLSVSRDCNSQDVINLLNNSKEVVKNDNNDLKKVENNTYYPVFNCPHCDTNILKTGYKIYEEVHFAFSEKNNKLEETNRIKNDNVLCSNCNKFINNTNTNFLENLCSINHCKKCGKDLTEIGINEKINMSFNEESNKFDKKEKTYNCVSCDEELSKHQIEYFKL